MFRTASRSANLKVCMVLTIEDSVVRVRGCYPISNQYLYQHVVHISATTLASDGTCELVSSFKLEEAWS